jgi:hypothetical protein
MTRAIPVTVTVTAVTILSFRVINISWGVRAVAPTIITFIVVAGAGIPILIRIFTGGDYRSDCDNQ